MLLYLRDNLQNYGTADLQRDLALLPQWRREQALAYKHFKGQRNCTLAYLLLCEGLEKEFGIKEQPRFTYNEHGKPSLWIGSEFGVSSHQVPSKFPPEIYFNLSHTDFAITCLLSDKPCGVDVESRGRYKESLARYCMNDEEMEKILGSEEPDLEFTRLWTQKEALVKMRGTGITDDVKNILSCHHDLSRDTKIRTEVHETYVISTAIETSTKR